jgi:hypothetical protein
MNFYLTKHAGVPLLESRAAQVITKMLVFALEQIF